MVEDEPWRLRCDQCDFQATSKRSMTLHRKQEHDQEIRCHSCDFVATSKDILENHLENGCKIQAGDKFPCEICGQLFKTLKCVNVHVKQAHQSNKFKCDSCDYASGSKKDLVHHFKNSHSFRCQLCNHVSQRMYQFKRHQLSHMTEKSIQCHLCDYTCKQKSQLDYHMIRIHENMKSFVCESCGLRFNTKGSLSRHVRRIHLQTLPPRSAFNKAMKCEICGHVLASKDVYRRHMLLQHSGISKQYKCNFCKYEAKEFGSLRDHTIGSHGKKLKCNYCTFSAPRHSRVISHTHEKHGDKPPFICESCNFFGNDIHVMGEHIKANHDFKDSVIVKYLEMLETLRKIHENRIYELRRNMGKDKAAHQKLPEKPTQSDNVADENSDHIANSIGPLNENVHENEEKPNMPINESLEQTTEKINQQISQENNVQEVSEVQEIKEEEIKPEVKVEQDDHFSDDYDVIYSDPMEFEPEYEVGNLVKVKLETNESDEDDEKNCLVIKGLPEEKVKEVEQLINNVGVKKRKRVRKNVNKKENKNHVKSEGIYECQDCGFVARTEVVLKSHMKRKHEQYVCKICFFTADKSSMKIHRKTHAQLKCKHCLDFSAQSKKDLEAHVAEKHGGEGRFMCDICGSAKKDATTLKVHMLTHSEEKPFKCKLCDYAGKQKRFLDIHYVRVHENKKHFVCDQCGKGYNDKLGLTRHLRSKHLKSAKARNIQATKCEVCNKILVSKDSYKRHMLLQHTNMPKLKCNVCKYEAKELGTLKDHVIGSHGKRLQCLFCSFSAPRHSRIISHTKSKHPDMYAFKCEVCDLTSDDVHMLNEHMINIHSFPESLIGKYLSLLESVMKQYDGRLWEKRRLMGEKVQLVKTDSELVS